MKQWTLCTIVISLLVTLSTGCSDTSGPDTDAEGPLSVTVTTGGADKDADGYRLAGIPESIGDLSAISESVKKAGPEVYRHEEEFSLPISTQQIELAGVAENCEVSGENPRAVGISAGQAAELSFEVVCSSQIEGDILFISDGNPLSEGESQSGENVLYEGININTGGGSDSQNSEESINVITSSDVDLTTPAASSDGSIFVWRDSRQGLSITRDGGTTIRPFTDSPGDTDPAFSSDDSLIVFTSERTGDKELFVKPANGAGPAENWSNSPDTDEYGAAWSPDGTKLAFTRSGQGDCKAQVMLFDMASEAVEPLTDTCGTFSGYPAWSPDGSELVILRENDSGALNLYVMGADGSGGEWQTMYNSGRLDKQAYPCWSSDDYIYFTSVGQTAGKANTPTMQATDHNSSRSNRSNYATDTDIFDGDTDADVRHISCPVM